MNERMNLIGWGGILFSGSAEAFASVEIKDGTYEILFGKKILYMRVMNSRYLSQTESICVCLNAAISSRENKTPPYFSGEGISNSVGCCLISFSDPSTHIEGVDLGWYVGNEGWLNFQRDLVLLIETITQKISKKLVIFGGSGGGYASFALSRLFSRKAFVIGMNPQFDISLYPSCNNFATRAFPKSKISDMQNFSKERDAWNHFFLQNGLITSFTHHDLNPLCDYLLLQSWNDTHHLRLHTPLVLPSLETLSLSKFYGAENNLSYFFGPWGDRHSVVWKEHITLVLQMAINGASSLQISEKLATEFLGISPDQKASSSKIKIPPSVRVEGSEFDLNLVRFTFEQFEKNGITESFFGLDFLRPLLVFGSSDLELYAVVASLQCWFNILQNNEELNEEIWKTKNFDHRVTILSHLGQEFFTRPAMKYHQSFLQKFIQFHLEEAEERGMSTESHQCLGLKELLLQLK